MNPSVGQGLIASRLPYARHPRAGVFVSGDGGFIRGLEGKTGNVVRP